MLDFPDCYGIINLTQIQISVHERVEYIMASKYDITLENQIIALYQEGMSPYQMVEKIPELKGKRPSVIYGILKRRRVSTRRTIVLTDAQRLSRRKYNLNDHYFDKIDSEHKAYWLGFLYADGYVTSLADKIGISLNSYDKKHLERFANEINFTGEVKDYEEKQGYAVGEIYSRILITSKQMKQSLINAGILEKKTTTLKFPTNQQVPVNLIWHFIRGYYDGDGSLTYGHVQKNGMQNYFIKITGTYDMIQNIQKVFQTNVKEEQRYPERGIDNYSITIGGNIQVCRILDSLYNNATIYLERKYNRYKQFLTSSMANATEGHRI